MQSIGRVGQDNCSTLHCRISILRSSDGEPTQQSPIVLQFFRKIKGEEAPDIDTRNHIATAEDDARPADTLPLDTAGALQQEPSGLSAAPVKKEPMGLIDRRRSQWLIIGFGCSLALASIGSLATLPPDRSPQDQSVLLSVDINSAAATELALLPGIGPVTARNIVDNRALHGPFDSVQELARVPGIGPKTIAACEPYATASARPAAATRSLSTLPEAPAP